MSNALRVLDNYNEKEFNILVPVQTMQDFPDIFKLAINTVKIDIKEDTYSQSGGLALNKIGLEKLMAAANIQIVESKQVMPSTVSYAIEMAKQLGQPVDFDKRDIAYKVTVKIPDLTGTFREIITTKEMIAEELHDECIANATAKKKSVAEGEKEFAQMMKFRNALCESKALNRAIRNALQIKSKFTAAELAKPFAVPIVVPNDKDPEMRKVMLDKYRIGSNLLYGLDVGQSESSIGIAAPQQFNSLPEPDETLEGNDFSNEDIEVLDGDYCEECESVIVDLNNGKGKIITKEQIIERSQKEYGQMLCGACLSAKGKQR